MAKAKGGLGKGLDALFVDNGSDASSISTLAISDIEPNQDQPRKQFEPTELAELADSIRQHGILQPLVVRPMPDGSYQLVAGERRWRASRMAGLTEVPVVIKELTDMEAMELALIENLQREDLNAIEEATGYRDLMGTFGLTQEQVSARVGKSRPMVTNSIRLLNLPAKVQIMVQDGKLSAGHARALLALEDEDNICMMAEEIIKKGLSVRQVELLMKRMKQEKTSIKSPGWENSFYTEVSLALSDTLSRKVKVEKNGKKGKLLIEFYDEEDLKTLLALFPQQVN